MNATMTATHPTPGPWRFDTERCEVVAGPDANVAVVSFHGADSLAQEQANGHLIAAAPDLLAALRELLAEALRSGLEGRPAVLLARAALLIAGGDAHAPTVPAPAAPPRQWLRLSEVCAMTTAGRSWIFERMKDQTDPFPASVRLSASRLTVWDAAQVSAWMARRTAPMKARDAD